MFCHLTTGVVVDEFSRWIATVRESARMAQYFSPWCTPRTVADDHFRYAAAMVETLEMD